ncbi:MAG: hypothetical protein ABSA63_08670 [Thermoplasmata archaeon]
MAFRPKTASWKEFGFVNANPSANNSCHGPPGIDLAESCAAWAAWPSV